MVSLRLVLQAPGGGTSEAAAQTLFWTNDGGGSFRTSVMPHRGALGPRLAALGPVKNANIDLARVAVAVYGADRSARRQVGRVNWTSRQIELTIPVLDPKSWRAVTADLEALLGFLSGDAWTLKFTGTRAPRELTRPTAFPDAKRFVLLSGGADSAVGALLARSEPDEHVLVSHVGATSIAPIQRDVVATIRARFPGGSTQHHQQILFTRTALQPDGSRLLSELSTRTRSLLFLALGLAMASTVDAPLWIPENGFASLNPPLGADQLGSLSTRTTHPWFLTELSRIAAEVGADASIENPFASQTKGEMFRWVADQMGTKQAGAFLSATNSCANTNRRFDGMSAAKHCGVCYGCLVRRASFRAAGLADDSTYVVDQPPSDAVAMRLRKASILPSIAGFVQRGISAGTIAAMKLPDGYSAGRARELCEKGARELEALL